MQVLRRPSRRSREVVRVSDELPYACNFGTDGFGGGWSESIFVKFAEERGWPRREEKTDGSDAEDTASLLAQGDDGWRVLSGMWVVVTGNRDCT